MAQQQNLVYRHDHALRALNSRVQAASHAWVPHLQSMPPQQNYLQPTSHVQAASQAWVPQTTTPQQSYLQPTGLSTSFSASSVNAVSLQKAMPVLLPAPAPPPTAASHGSHQSQGNLHLLANVSTSSHVLDIDDLPQFEVPSLEVQRELVDLFFVHIHPWCPILHFDTTKETLLEPPVPVEGPDRIILHAIIASTLKFWTGSLSDDVKRQFYQKSKDRVLAYGVHHSSVKALQALVILAIEEMGCSNETTGFKVLDMLTRSVVRLGLSMEQYSPGIAPQDAPVRTLHGAMLPKPRNWVEEESRRRLFWMVYTLACFTTIITNSDFPLEDEDFDRRLPCRDELFRNVGPKVQTPWPRDYGQTGASIKYEHPEWLGPFSYYVEILSASSIIHQFLKKPLDITSLTDVDKWKIEYQSLSRAIEGWKSAVPDEYGDLATRSFNPATLRARKAGLVMLYSAFNM